MSQMKEKDMQQVRILLSLTTARCARLWKMAKEKREKEERKRITASHGIWPLKSPNRWTS